LGRADSLVYFSGNVIVGMLAVSGMVEVIALSNVRFSGGAAALIAYGGGGCNLAAWFAGMAASASAVVLYGGSHRILINVAGSCKYAVEALDGASVSIGPLPTCSATLTALSALLVGALSKVAINDAAAGFLGATAGQEAYICQMDVAVKSATWPAAAGYVTDAKGGELLRVA
jgi:hypothetical protein